jgi:tRNA(Ile)-lysidine synthase
MRGEARAEAVPAPVVALLDRCTFPPPGTPVTCAVSGGRDSLALLVLAVAAGCEVRAVHVDHGLRPESAAEAKVVADAAARFGARSESVPVDVAPGPNLEARARAARYAALPPGVLTGHTADDQAETVLLNLLRGAGLDGLSGMGRTDQRRISRPLLRLRRAETGAVCDAVGLVPVDDPSNLDPSIRRNRVRHEILPLLDAVAGREVVPVLARQAELLAADAAMLDELAAGLDPTDARALAAAPSPLARRAIRTWLRSTGERHPPDAATVERVLTVARGERTATELAGGRRVSRSGWRLRVDG